MSPCANVILVGLSGAGKTSCAQILSRLMSLAVLDTDDVIQKRHGSSVASIFAEQGEAHFRALERALIEELLQTSLQNTVISVGGGLPAQGDNARLLKELGFTVFLNARPDTLARRLAADLSRDVSLRPLLARGGDCKGESLTGGAAETGRIETNLGKIQTEKPGGETGNSTGIDKNLEATLAAQLAKRRKYYEVAHLVIDTEGKSAEEICREIQTIIINKGF